MDFLNLLDKASANLRKADKDISSLDIVQLPQIENRFANNSVGKLDSKLFSSSSFKNPIIPKDTDKLFDKILAPVADISAATSIQKTLTKKQQKEKTTLSNWFDMQAVEITPELQRDLQVLRLRNVLDPKRFYKKDKSLLGGALTKKALNQKRFLQIGTVMDSPFEINNRLTRKERKTTIVQELLNDSETRAYQQKKYKELEEKKRNAVRGSSFDVRRNRMNVLDRMGKSRRSKK